MSIELGKLTHFNSCILYSTLNSQYNDKQEFLLIWMFTSESSERSHAF